MVIGGQQLVQQQVLGMWFVANFGWAFAQFPIGKRTAGNVLV